MDCLYLGKAKKNHIALTLADVTESAKELERRHLCGPVSGQILAQALAMVGIMSANLDRQDERICARLECDGAIGGFTVEASREGKLRGFTNIKILNELDGDQSPELTRALGDHGRLTVVQSLQGRVIYSGIVHLKPVDVRVALAKFFNESLQRPAAAYIYTETKDHYLHKAWAILAEKMPDATSEDFVPVLEAFDEGRIAEILSGESFRWENLREIEGLNDLQINDRWELSFACDCSFERIYNAVKGLDRPELEAIAAEGKGQEGNCHFCGKDYFIPHEDILKMLQG